MEKEKMFPRLSPVRRNRQAEQGFILVMALLMLVVLSLMGAAAMLVRNTEVSIVNNTEVMLTNFYAVEAVTLEGTTVLENVEDDILNQVGDASFVCNGTGTDPNGGGISPADMCWLKPNPTDSIDLTKSATWFKTSADITPADTLFNSGTTNIGNRILVPTGYDSDGTVAKDRIMYAAVLGNMASDTTTYDICRGADVSDPDKVEKCFSVYGMYDVKSGTGKAYSGRRMLMVGYKKMVYY